MRALLIDKDALNNLREYAEKNPIAVDELLKIQSGAIRPVGKRSEHICELPVGFKIVYSIEQHHHGKWYRHLSVSVDAPGRLPHPENVDAIMDELGFKHDLHSGDLTTVYIEEEKAINVIEDYP